MFISLASQIITEKVTPGDPVTHLLYGRHLPCLKAHICKLSKLTLEFDSYVIILIYKGKRFTIFFKKKRELSLFLLLEKENYFRNPTRNILDSKKKEKPALKFPWRNNRKYSRYEIKPIVNLKRNMIS